MSMLDLSYAADAIVYCVDHHVNLLLVVTVYVVMVLYVLDNVGDSREMWILECS